MGFYVGFNFVNNPKEIQNALSYARSLTEFELDSTKPHLVFSSVLKSNQIIRHIPDYLTTEDGLVFEVDPSLPEACNIH